MESHEASLVISQGEVRMLNEILHSPVARHRPSRRYAHMCQLSEPPPQHVTEVPTPYEPPSQYDIGFITNNDASRTQHHHTYGTKETEARAVSYSSPSPCTALSAMYASSGYKPVESPRAPATSDVHTTWTSYGTPPQHRHEQSRDSSTHGQGYELSPVQALVPPSFGTLSYMPTYLPGTNIQYQHNYTSISRPYSYAPPAETTPYHCLPPAPLPPTPIMVASPSIQATTSDELQDNAKKPPRTCKYANCMKTIQRHGLCHKHGGVRKCTKEGCSRKDRGEGFCVAHGGGKRCAHDSCEKVVRRGLYCMHHSVPTAAAGNSIRAA
ncbi:hypothetical protein SDRG_10566 [Saprolegnia diclina VS20]|uniref:Uncharacterized protein n=1 Tax=Saprolegnia diclina (strain VS20) TaxID=1156394 RepID=T0RNY0_SAPDV|nr:hypothetical protein SDRG_10566 [Saprolegnia diclina VS20]EQC31777.1 hypothetical protein SDRG_10566 [Saprolegnia diclina VS20]|eukprot:XP_008614784.1 hypothetical protein SDRG_10566 [Saprolegnia diclina VS20]